VDTTSIATPTDIFQRSCEHCGKQLVRNPTERPSRFSGRRFCDKTCSNRAKPRPPQPDRVGEPFGSTRRTDGRYEDLLMLIDAGESVHHIPRRLGTTPGALSRWLRRNGHPQLATLFESVTRAA
jgi:hypothetical protein